MRKKVGETSWRRNAVQWERDRDSRRRRCVTLQGEQTTEMGILTASEGWLDEAVSSPRQRNKRSSVYRDSYRRDPTRETQGCMLGGRNLLFEQRSKGTLEFSDWWPIRHQALIQ
jgi:hypothetical protein